MSEYHQQQVPVVQSDVKQQPAATVSQYDMAGHQHGMDEKHQHGIGGGKWAFGMFDCFAPMSTCCVGFWCPCYLFGKTYQRNKTGEQDPSGFNGMCAAWCLLGYCGFASCLQCVTRGSQRDKYNIEGNMCGDFCGSLCCGCCTLIQEEKESIVRQTGIDPTTKQPYVPVGQMTYP